MKHSTNEVSFLIQGFIQGDHYILETKFQVFSMFFS